MHEEYSLDDARPSEEHAEPFSTGDVPLLEPEHATSNDAHPPSVTWICILLFSTVIGFTINTEATVYYEDVLQWKKPMASLYITHSCLMLPWMMRLLYLRTLHRRTWQRTWFQTYLDSLRASIASVDAFAAGEGILGLGQRRKAGGQLQFLATAAAIIAVVLTCSGLSWFLSVSLTTPADLTAIYNCSTFFAAVFSIPLLRERLGWASISAVALSILGTVIIAYGDAAQPQTETPIGSARLFGNLIALCGAIAFGLYEVLVKKWTSASSENRRASSASASLDMTLGVGALVGFYTLTTIWAALILFHFLQVERLEWPTAYASLWIAISVLSGSFSITSLVVLVNWTDPVFGSMANVLPVFTTAIADWLVWGLRPSAATYVGGVMIFVAFVLLARDSLVIKN